MTIRLTRYFGISLQRMPDAEGRMYLTGVVWYPRSRKLVGYLYPSAPLFDVCFYGGQIAFALAALCLTYAIA